MTLQKTFSSISYIKFKRMIAAYFSTKRKKASSYGRDLLLFIKKGTIKTVTPSLDA